MNLVNTKNKKTMIYIIISLLSFWIPLLIFYKWLGIANSYSAYFPKLRDKKKWYGLFFRMSLWAISIPMLIYFMDMYVFLSLAALLIFGVGIFAGRRGYLTEEKNHIICATGGILSGSVSLAVQVGINIKIFYLIPDFYSSIIFAGLTFWIFSKKFNVRHKTLWIEAAALTVIALNELIKTII